ncbi:GntR family transcriptional regulator [Micromonospora sp. NPDC048830]|uniref:GntR family transcriptional regulator n=1 Tax=Micromonospora sp. NPDC048830 TaxID=3364257 RepID=UPI00371B81E4
MTNPLQIVVDRSSPIPLYFQVAEQIEAAINQGVLAPGEKVENEVTLAAELGLSRPTMRQAIQTLVNKGLVVRKRGVGTQVVQSKVRRSVGLTSLYDDLASANQDPRSDILRLERIVADEPARTALALNPGDKVWHLRRLRFIGEEPLAIMTNYIPTTVADLESFDLENGGLYGSLRQHGVHMQVARQRIGARRAEGDEARLLRQARGAPLLTMSRTSYDSAGRIVEYCNHVYRPDLYSFETTLVDR